MSNFEMAKAVVELGVSYGVGGIVGNIVNSTLPAAIGPIKRGCIVAGTFVLGSMAGEAAVDWTEKKLNYYALKIQGVVRDHQ